MKAPEVYLASNLDGMISDNFAGYIWSIKMKARNYIGLMILTSLLLSGCQATPAQDIVANKNDHQTEQSKAESVVDSTEVADDEKIVSEGYSESFASDSGDVIINIQVGQVKVRPIPVMQAEAQDISVDDVKQWSKAFFGTEDVYEGNSQMTKSEIQEEILLRQQWINDRDRLITEEGYTEEAADAVIQSYQEEIDNLKANYESAPESDERQKTDWTFHPASYYMKTAEDGEDEDWGNLDKTDKLKVIGDCDGKMAYVSASNRSTPDYQLHSIMFYWDDEQAGWENNGKSSISQEEAVKLTNQKLKELTDGEWTVNAVWSIGNQWRIQYVPSIDQIPCVYSTIDYTADDTYASNLDYEQIDFSVTDDQIVSAECDTPMKVTSADSQTSELKSFAELYDAFKTYMKVSTSVSSLGVMEDDSEDAAVNITKIQQMYCRVKEKNTDNTYQYVPVYAFLGKISVSGTEDTNDSIFCLIHAIDGTIINAGLGY